MAKPIGTLGVIDTLTVGGRVFTDLANLKTLVAQEGASATTVNCTFREVGTNTGYVVPGGKTFKLFAISIINVTANLSDSASAFDLIYADNDVGFGTNTAFTNRVYMGGASGLVRFASRGLLGTSLEVSVNFNIPAGKYPAIESIFQATGQEKMVIAYGYEV